MEDKNIEIIPKPAIRGGERFKKTQLEKEELKVAKSQHKKWKKQYGVK